MSSAAAVARATADRVWLPGGTFLMGSDLAEYLG